MIQAIRINDGATSLVYACGAALLINTFSPQLAFKGASLAIKAARMAAGQVLRLNGSCFAAYQMLSAADHVAGLASYESSHSRPVFLESDTRSYWNLIGRWCTTAVRAGPNVTSWTGYKATYRC
jgi:hypothetical protein